MKLFVCDKNDQNDEMVWVGPQRTELAGKQVNINGHTFTIGIWKYMTANEIALTSNTREKFKFDEGINIDVTIN